MTTSSSRRNVLLGGSALLATGAAPSLFSLANAQSGNIKIGFPVPLTGAFSAEAQDQVRCAQIAIEEFNATGGFNGRKAELLVRDDKLNPGEAATRTLPLTAMAFLPVAFGMHRLYEWTHPHVVASDVLLQKKALYLNIPFFTVRAVLAFAAWMMFGPEPRVSFGLVAAALMVHVDPTNSNIARRKFDVVIVGHSGFNSGFDSRN